MVASSRSLLLMVIEYPLHTPYDTFPFEQAQLNGLQRPIM